MLAQVLTLAIGIVLIRWAVSNYKNWRLRRSGSAREGAEFKQKLSPWVKQVESLLFLVFFLLFGIGGVFLSFDLYRIIHGIGTASPIAGTLLLSPMLLAGPLALMTSNFISWSIPAMRNANEKAMEGLPSVSYQKYQRQLLTVVMWMAPLCVLGLAIGLFDPWL